MRTHKGSALWFPAFALHWCGKDSPATHRHRGGRESRPHYRVVRRDTSGVDPLLTVCRAPVIRDQTQWRIRHRCRCWDWPTTLGESCSTTVPPKSCPESVCTRPPATPRGCRSRPSSQRAGGAVVTSHASHYYANIEEGNSSNTFVDLAGVYRGYDRIRELADSPDLILPGHELLCRSDSHRSPTASSFQRFSCSSPGRERDAARWCGVTGT